MAVTAAQLEVVFQERGSKAVVGALHEVDGAIQSSTAGFDELYDTIRSGAGGAIDALSGMADALGKISLMAGTAIFGMATKAAFDQVRAVERATVALRAYEKDISKVDAVLQGLVEYAQSDMGVLFNRTELFASAQALKMYGAETENLTDYVKILSRSVGLGLSNWTDLNRVIGRVGSTGRLVGNDFDYLVAAGFRLDDSLRNANLTWQELFDALDRGIPADALAGQAQTIDGALIRLQSSIRGLGLELLDVDQKTSTFAEGGLGDRLVSGILAATEALRGLRPAAGAFADALGFIGDGVTGLVDLFRMLPSSVQSFAGQLLAAVAGIGMFRQAIVMTRAALNTLGLSAFGRMLSPIGLAITGIAIAAGALWTSFQRAREATQNLNNAMKDLVSTQNDLLLGGLDAQAERLAEFAELMASIPQLMAQQKNAILTQIYPNWWEESPNPDQTPLQWLDDLNDAYSFTADETNRFAQVQRDLGAALADVRVDGVALMGEIWDIYNRMMTDPNYTGDQLLADLEGLVSRIGEFRDESAAAAESADGLADSTLRTSDAIKAMDEALQNPEASLERLDARFEALAERQREWIESALQILGMDDPLSQWNLTGNASDAAELANNLNDAAAAAESVFRVIVGNTNAIKSQADATLQWADNLIAVRGEYSRLDELVEKGLITGTSGVFDDGSQYAEAQNAYDSIAESVERIHDNLDAVQAIQAPLIAEMTEQAAAYTDELLAMEPAQQLVALGWMDSATSAKAMEIAMLGASAAAGDLGVNGVEAFASLVMGAAQADPVLKALLVDMGIISEGADGTITINTDGLESAKADLDDINTTLGHLIDTLKGDDLGTYELKIKAELDTSDFTDGSGWVGEGIGRAITIPVSADTGPAALELNAFKEDASTPVTVPVSIATDFVGEAVSNALGAFGGGESADSATITVNLQDNATEGLLDIGSTLGGLDAASALVVVNGDNSDALQATLETQLALFALDGQSAMIQILGDNSGAMAAINEIAAYDGTVLATSYIDIVSRQIGPSVTAHAKGGFVRSDFQLVGEEGPELVQLPYGSYVHTARETQQMLSASAYSGYGVSASDGGNVTIAPTIINNIDATGQDIDEDGLAERITYRTMTAMADEFRRHTTAHSETTS